MNSTTLWKQDLPAQLADTLRSIDTLGDMQSFLRDILTEKEIIEISSRLEAARLLKSGKTYAEITSSTKLSSRTVARINEWLKNGENGYEKALARIADHHSHTSPARD